MKSVSITALLATSALLLACNDSATTEQAEGVIPQHQLDALEKAKGVEKQLQDAAKKVEDY